MLLHGFGFSAFLFFIALYFLPTILAVARSKANVVAIFLVNLFFGWSVIGWIIALVWAVSTERVDQARLAQPFYQAAPRRYCPNCGKYEQPGARFCANCGVASAG